MIPRIVKQWWACRLIGHRWISFYELEACPVEYRRCARCGWVRHACDEIDWSAVERRQKRAA